MLLLQTGSHIARARVAAAQAGVDIPHVLLQVEVAAEALGAHATLIGLEVGVRVHVELEVVDLVEGLAAHAARVLLGARVRQPVVLVVALLVEALATELAHPRLVVLVDAHVRVERGAAVEGLVAQLAHVRLVARVNDLVAAEGGGLAEALAAHLRFRFQIDLFEIYLDRLFEIEWCLLGKLHHFYNSLNKSKFVFDSKNFFIIITVILFH